MTIKHVFIAGSKADFYLRNISISTAHIIENIPFLRTKWLKFFCWIVYGIKQWIFNIFQPPMKINGIPKQWRFWKSSEKYLTTSRYHPIPTIMKIKSWFCTQTSDGENRCCANIANSTVQSTTENVIEIVEIWTNNCTIFSRITIWLRFLPKLWYNIFAVWIIDIRVKSFFRLIPPACP